MDYPNLDELKEADLKKLDDLDSSANGPYPKIKMSCGRCGKLLKGHYGSRFCSSSCEDEFYNQDDDLDY